MEEERLLKASREKEPHDAQAPATKERGGSWQNEAPAVRKDSRKIDARSRKRIRFQDK